MKIPKITWEAIQAAAGEPVRSGTIYDWLQKEQPNLCRAVDRMPQGVAGYTMSGAALVAFDSIGAECVEHS